MNVADGSGDAPTVSARRSIVDRLKAKRGFHEENVWARELVGTRSRQATPRLPQRHEQEPKAWMTLGILYEEDAGPSVASTSSTTENAERAKLVERCTEIAELRKTITDLEGSADLHPEHSRTAQQNAALRRESMREAERAKWFDELDRSKQRKSAATLTLQGLDARLQETEGQYHATCKRLQELQSRGRQDLAANRSALEQAITEYQQRSLVASVEAEAEDAQIDVMLRRLKLLRDQLAAAAATPLARVRPESSSATVVPVLAKPQDDAPLRRWLLLSEAVLAKHFEEAMATSRAELEFESRAAAVETEQLRLAGAVEADTAGVNWAETEILRARAAQLGFEVEDAIAEFLSTAIWGASMRSNQTTPTTNIFTSLSRSPTPLALRPKSVLA